MVINAAETFRCTHSYIAAPRSSKFMFSCHRCGHRVEFLPVRVPRTSDTICIAYTAFGALQVRRGIIKAPEEVGTRCGWTLLEDDDDDSLPQMIHPERSARGSRAH
jgi:hypothetical protein